ncbi:unnamed protein product, partial [Amoebophrya sp. A25]
HVVAGEDLDAGDSGGTAGIEKNLEDITEGQQSRGDPQTFTDQLEGKDAESLASLAADEDQNE